MKKSLTKQIKQLYNNIKKIVMLDEFFVKNSLNKTQIQILIYLVRNSNKKVCQKDLEIETNLKKASITGTLDSLEKKGIIERQAINSDKRKK